ncbi:hypothetical protein WJX77_003159 [Trebouxia sp. C0004]
MSLPSCRLCVALRTVPRESSTSTFAAQLTGLTSLDPAAAQPDLISSSKICLVVGQPRAGPCHRGDTTNGLDKLTPELWAKVLFIARSGERL